MRSRFLGQVLGAYLLCRLFSFVVLTVVARHQAPVTWTGPHPDYLSMTVLWDGSWYRDIAEHGYPVPLPTDPGTGGLVQNAWAFYPAFPLLARLLMTVTGLGFPVVASTLALACGAAAAVVIAVLLRDRVGPRAAFAAVLVCATFVASPILQVAYTESLAMLLLAGFLLALSRERWLVASALALGIGVTRPIAVPLGVVALVGVVLRWRHRSGHRLARGEALSMVTVLAACGVAGLAWPVIAWWRTGVRSAYTDTMATWRSAGEVTPFRPWLDISRYLAGDTIGPTGLAALVVVLVLMVAGPWARALGPQLRAWCLAYPAYLGAVLDPWTSIFRYALPLFPLAVVLVGGGWDGRSPRGLRWRTGLLVVAGLLAQVWWVWELYRFVPPSDYPP
jgi:hypothetical protein